MGTYEDRAKLIWSLSGSGLSTTISAAGNSGTWGDTPTADYPSSPVGLSPATDFQLMVYVTGKTSTPTFAVQLGYYDGLGNLFQPTALLLAVPVTGVPGTPAAVFLNAGARAGSGGSNTYFAFPQYGQVSWTCTGGSVSGVEIQGGILPGAMPPLHRYLGNPVLTGIGRLFFKSPVGDFHCGLRAFRREAIEELGLRTLGMEFATEMVVKATAFGLRVTEIPTTLSPDGRDRAPHLRTWRDGWRHLRFLLLYSPRWLFLYPGMALFLLGAIVSALLVPGPRTIGNVAFDVDTLLFAAMAILIGFQSIVFAMFTKVFAISEGLLPEDPRLSSLFRYVTLETGLITGVMLILAGSGAWVLGLEYWRSNQFGPLNPATSLRIVIPGVVFLTLGFQVILSSFFLSVLGMGRR